jgi:hypothetical protein
MATDTEGQQPEHCQVQAHRSSHLRRQHKDRHYDNANGMPKQTRTRDVKSVGGVSRGRWKGCDQQYYGEGNEEVDGDSRNPRAPYDCQAARQLERERHGRLRTVSLSNLGRRQIRRKPGSPPNKRLKLTGVHRFKGILRVVPWRARTYVHHSCASERVARSLSAIR